MKITAVKTVVVHAGDRNWVLVRVETNEAGLYGWGEGTLEWKTRAVVGCIDDFVPMLIGRDPRDITGLFERMVKHSFWPLGVIGLTAVSAIEQALWDILGKDCGKPVWQLLGGRVRERVRVYAHVGSSIPNFKRWPIDPQAYGEAARDLVERGYTAVKTLPIPVTHYSTDREGIRLAEQLAIALREGVGPDADILFDFHGRATSVSAAVDYTKAVAVCSPMFVEEPVQPGDPVAMALVADRTGVPIATGERLLTLPEFQALADLRAVSFFQPDLCHCGGFTVGRAIAAVGAAAQIGIAPHNPMGPIASVVGLHFAVATPNFVILEQLSDRFDFFSRVADTPITMKDGYWEIPQRPGLGVEIDMREAAKHPFEQESIAAGEAIFAADGTVGHW
jgi:galactonate dehydratase